jgi:hypothetical protein
MKNLFTNKSTRILSMVLCTLLCALGALIFWFRPFVQPFLMTILVLGALWFVIDFSIRAMRRKKQASFDEKVAAKEGIEDRKHEWSGWVAELKKQGIDRSELPFYLLVGEPQSGKSVLLQNSDLHFPFGQSRLSGVGGTRGCDWWFTDEAVILDLAGRLFTHEGGASDEAEWEAFLDLLVDFRPLCPANGVILVLPCDGLLTDSAEESTKKANQILSALRTLTNRIQARLPIYVVLTKADKVFGFAETVHRLDTSKRHEMFGWSRPAEKGDAPFDLEEIKEAFEDLVGRGRLLRSSTLASVRIPEAIPEVDRLFSFPDELAALHPAVHLYLERIFSESTLVERLTCRGLYLTSGLQTGAPIAKVCADIIGCTGEADRRDLEGLFSKQRAYFIKDFVRKRVFSERGLVRPTQVRVAHARRNAIVGYAIAGGIAAISIFGSIFHLSSGKESEEYAVYAQTLAHTRGAVEGDYDTPGILGSLGSISRAVDADRETMEEIFGGSRESFVDLYCGIFDRRLVPTLRERAEETVRDGLRADPETHPAFQELSGGVMFLLEPVDFGKQAHVDSLLEIVPDRLQIATRMGGEGAGNPLTLSSATERRRSCDGPAEPVSEPVNSLGKLSPTLTEAVGRMEILWHGVLRPGSLWQVPAELGCIVAWKGLYDSHAALDRFKVGEDRGIHALADQYGTSMQSLARCMAALVPGDSGSRELQSALVASQLEKVMEQREQLRSLARLEGGTGSWPAAAAVESFATSRFFPGTDAGGQGLRSGASIAMPAEGLLALQNEQLARACDPSFLPSGSWKPGDLVAQVRSGKRLFLDPEEVPPRAITVFRGKLLEVGGEFARRYPEWNKLAEELAANASPEVRNGDVAPLEKGLVGTLTDLRTALSEVDETLLVEWISSIDALLLAHLEEVLVAWDAGGERFGEEGIDWEVVAGLHAAAQVTPSGSRSGASSGADRLRARAGLLWVRYLSEGEERLVDRWAGLEPEGPHTLAMIRELEAHMGRLGEILDPTRDLAEVDRHSDWLLEVDGELSRRLDVHRTTLTEHWSSPPARAWSTLSAAASAVLEKTDAGALRSRMNLAGELPVPDLTDPALRSDSILYESFRRSREAVGALRQFESSLSPQRLLDHEYTEWLRGFVRPFREDAALAQNGPRMAEAYGSGRLSTGSVLQPPRGAGGFYVRSLYASFEECLVDEIRTRYLADFAQRILREYETVVDALLTSDLERLAGIDDTALMNRVYSLFDREGALDELLSDYRIGVEGIDFRPEPEQASSHDRAGWEFDRFLIDLQVFLLGPEGRRVRQSPLIVYVEPTTDDPSTIWHAETEGGMTYYYYPASSVGDWEFAVTGERMDELSLEWDFQSGSQKKLRMRWSETIDQGQGYTSGDASLVVPTSLAPLILAWLGRPDGNAWALDLVPTGSKLRAPFTLTFLDRTLPERPADPR